MLWDSQFMLARMCRSRHTKGRRDLTNASLAEKIHHCIWKLTSSTREGDLGSHTLKKAGTVQRRGGERGLLQRGRGRYVRSVDGELLSERGAGSSESGDGGEGLHFSRCGTATGRLRTSSTSKRGATSLGERAESAATTSYTLPRGTP